MRTLKTISMYFNVKTKETLVYRGNIVLWILGWLFSFLAMVYLWHSVQAEGTIAGFTSNQIITYYFIGLLVWAICGWYCFYDVSDMIKQGGIVNFLLKPINFHHYNFASELAWHTVNLSIFSFFFGIIFLFVRKFLFFDLDPSRLFLFLFSLVLTCLVTFEFNLLLSMATFWTVNRQGVGSLYWIIFSLLGGQLLPLNFFPSSWQPIVKILPFRFMYSFPLEIYLNQIKGTRVYLDFALACFWIISLYFLFNFFWRKGLKIYTGVGQ